MTDLHTVLGASGASGQAILKECVRLQLTTRAVTRSLKLPDQPTVHADLLDREAARKAIAGSSVVFLCAALPYSGKVWTRDWPIMMENVIDACAQNEAILVFLDNVYLYGPPPLPVPFDENTQQHPTTVKGKARKRAADLLLSAFAKNKIRGVIGRSADFYGPNTTNSMLYILFLERMLQGKNPQFLGPTGIPHTYANTTDNAKALLALARASDTHQQVWHLPVGAPMTIEKAVDIFNLLLQTDFNVMVMPNLIRHVASWFHAPLREVNEMMYQFQQPYHMSYNKFRERFPDIPPTPYATGFKDMIESFRKTAS